MEHVNIRNAAQTNHLPHPQLEEQLQNENQQQFCLRWHNHQTSLLSTLPMLLDQSHLTDVTISAEGRMLRAHRVILSACSTFFMDIFRALDASSHPVIIIPGANFNAIVALLSFMYSGEVNVYEEQIPMLLSLAETLGIKGLADVQNNNIPKQTKDNSVDTMHFEKAADLETPSRQPTPVAPTSQLSSPCSFLGNKLTGCTPLENLFLKSLQLYPNLLPQPLNFSQTALDRTNELLTKYQQQCQLYQESQNEDLYTAKRLKTVPSCNATERSSPLQAPQQLQQKDVKRIDKIVESLRGINNNISNSNSITSQSPNESTPNLASSPITMAQSHFSLQQPVKSSSTFTSTNAKHHYTKPLSYNVNTSSMANHHNNHSPYISPEDQAKLQQHIEQYAACQREAVAAAAAAASCSMVSAKSEPNLLSLTEKLSVPVTSTKAPSNSKMYATCFICHKQMSNQYNLRVHLETHQNVRYACNVCSHVSRSKDALRKHVSYRHPGAPSPCENEARRKRITKLSTAAVAPIPTATSVDLGSVAGEAGFTSTSNEGISTMAKNPYMFLPNQFQLAAAAAAVAVADSNTTPSMDLPISIKCEAATTAFSKEQAGEADASIA
ncbi:protein jim lovell [Scaptodrosophila lebanonensis]|uniref:Protein jim lovell n=1 Tax=Drosophila lebanonensis TaxID=7225 RepID=A0A6J2TIW8_DROLE|nr:protein jim lovell [Scaptodrosophila lebanonensis]XP_030375385.1 protein jim lovell [Scaptodrosophila lebanonensis]XP_030375387.1 protein jim lovell [Scaptodrosophila lebanonensis]XP_030375388.1 protein jim lovell [Scaptodrosophila lebanonensis]